MIKIIILIVLGIIILSGIGYFLYQLYRIVRFGVSGPKKCYKVLTKLTKKKMPIMVTNIIKDDRHIVDKHSKVCKKVMGKEAAIFPTLQIAVVKFIWDFMKDLSDKDLKAVGYPSYKELFITNDKSPGLYIVLYIPSDYADKYVAYVKNKQKEEHHAEISKE